MSSHLQVLLVGFEGLLPSQVELVVQNSLVSAGDEMQVDPWVQKMPWRRKWQPTPVFLPGESPWMEEPGGLQSSGSQRAGHDRVTAHLGLITVPLLFWSCRRVCVSSLYLGPASTDDRFLYPSTQYMHSLNLVNVWQLHHGIIALFAL